MTDVSIRAAITIRATYDTDLAREQAAVLCRRLAAPDICVEFPERSEGAANRDDGGLVVVTVSMTPSASDLAYAMLDHLQAYLRERIAAPDETPNFTVRIRTGSGRPLYVGGISMSDAGEGLLARFIGGIQLAIEKF